VKSESIYIIPRPIFSTIHSKHIIQYISPAETRHFCDSFLSICQSVYHIPFVDSELERRKIHVL